MEGQHQASHLHPLGIADGKIICETLTGLATLGCDTTLLKPTLRWEGNRWWPLQTFRVKTSRVIGDGKAPSKYQRATEEIPLFVFLPIHEE